MLQHRPGISRLRCALRSRPKPTVLAQAVVRPLSRTPALEDHTLKLQRFADESLESFSLGIMGDLHLAPEQMHLFHDARAHFQAAMCGAAPGSGRMAQLGDLGHGKHRSGSRACFEYARDFMQSFQIPYAMILGNHDLEGDEFATDPDNLEAWLDTWQQPHHWAAPLGRHVTVIGLSTVRYRNNNFSNHEVFIDDAQVAWFEAQLRAATAAQRAVIVLTHAPPQGCGLKCVQEVHVKNRCAWLNHTEKPERFLDLVSRHPAIKLWFSGHFHLSHNYADSVSVVGGAAFVQVGVIGECHRDGHRHSRLIRGTASGWELCTVEHSKGGRVRVDAAGTWTPGEAPRMLTPQEEIIRTEDAVGWLTSQIDCSISGTNGADGKPVTRKQAAQKIRWFPVGPRTIVALQGTNLVEYDMATAAPIGLLGKVPPGCEVVLRGADGGVLPEGRLGDGSDVAVVEVVDALAGGATRYPRNEQGAFFVIYHPNKWKLKQAKLLAEREAALAEAAAAAAAAGAVQQ